MLDPAEPESQELGELLSLLGISSWPLNPNSRSFQETIGSPGVRPRPSIPTGASEPPTQPAARSRSSFFAAESTVSPRIPTPEHHSLPMPNSVRRGSVDAGRVSAFPSASHRPISGTTAAD
eukprot:TRINITY_DN1952_c1_g2_i5.p2 TRINITY_DN1952_c1_g2~~TRINITY_DN1952_c1_g2_i5.p2  ORF type:complete len:121 (+),score=9.57 TRINITY_DN1952_c1_g2_i5:359-721(+)